VEERDFLAAADAELASVEAALEGLLETGVDIDVELKPGGIIEIGFADDSKIIVNRHAAAREIWVAARSGGFHFRPPVEPGVTWTGTRDGLPLQALLSRCVSEQAGQRVQLVW